MKLVPFELRSVIQVALAMALPLLPLVLTVIPLEELLTRLAKLFLL